MRISISLELASGSFDSDVARSTKQFEKRMRDMEKRASAAGKAIGLAVVAAGTGLALFISKQADAIGKFKDLSEKIGDTAEALASLKPAADTTGTTFDTIAAASIKLTKGIAGIDEETKGAGAALAFMGLKLEDIKRMSPVEQMDAVAKALQGVGDGADRTNLALALYGKAGADLLPFLNELATTSKRQITLTQAEIEAADDYTDAMAKLRGEFGTLSSVAAAQMIPVLNDTLTILRDSLIGADGMTEAMKKLRLEGDIKQWTQDFAVGLVSVGEEARDLARVLYALAGSVSVVFAELELGLEQAKFALNPGRLLSSDARDQLAQVLEDRNKTLADANERWKSLLDNYGKSTASDRLRALFNKQNADLAGAFNPLASLQSLTDTSPLIFREGMADRVVADQPGTKPKFDPNGDNIAKSAKAAIPEIERLLKSFREQSLLYGDLTKTEEVRISLAEKLYGITTPAQEAQLMALAQELDAKDALAESEKAYQEIVKKRIDAENEAIIAKDEAIQDGLEDIEELLRTEEESIRKSYAARQKIVEDAVTAQNISHERGAELKAGLDKKMVEDIKNATDEMTVFWEQAARNMQDALADFLFDPFQDGLDGMLKSLGETLRKLAAQAAAEQIFKAIGNYGKANAGAEGYVGVLAGIASAFGGARASGGPVWPGASFLVGERGPERFVPEVAGTIVPNGGWGGGATNYFTVNVSAPQGNLPKESLNQLRHTLGSAVGMSMRRQS